MPHHLDPQESVAFFVEKYAGARSRAARQLERAALGHDVGLNGYTTVAQADTLGDQLRLSGGARLLDLGAGRGWPGSHVARSSGCRLVSTDVPWEALREAKAEGDARGRPHPAVGANGRALPFRAGSFDAIVHADVFC